MSDILDLLRAGAGVAVGDVEISSALLPPIVLQAPLAADDAPPSLLVRLLRPKVIMRTTVGDVTIAPAGDPPAFPWVGALLALALVLGLVALRAEARA